VKYLSSALMLLLFCMPCQAMQRDTLESILNPPRSDKPNPLSLQFMLNAPEPEDDQSNHSDLEIDDIPPINNVPLIHNRSKMINERGETGYECKYCKRMLPCATSRNRHERSHLTQRRSYRPAEKDADGTLVYPCQYCTRMCKNAPCRWAHEERCLAKKELGIAREKTIKCDQCDYACFYQYELERHSLTHLTYRPYNCYCSHAFKTLQTLQFHGKKCSKYQAVIRLMNNQSAGSMTDLHEDNQGNNNNDHQMQQAE
jgi:hypothetical protein